MKKTVMVLAGWMAFLAVAGADEIRVAPQAFDAGGWVLDAQFTDVIGSPCLLAHGLGRPVVDATAAADVPTAGKWRVWVRTKNWADGAPGRFEVLVNGQKLKRTFGAGERVWAWEDGGEVELGAGPVKLVLRDLTGFDGRCAGVVFNRGKRPEGAVSPLELPVAETVESDFVVVGGGVPGTCAAVSAARAGVRVTLVQDRPVLGGNSSAEIRVHSSGEPRHPLVWELRGAFKNMDPDLALSDAKRMRIVQDEPNVDLRILHRAIGVEMKDGRIAAVTALDLKRNRLVRFAGRHFVDATGDGWIGYWAKADWRSGREARSEYDESFAPEKADADTLGASIMWTSGESTSAQPFSAPWAEPFACGLSQVKGDWFWEYGIHRDMIGEAEEIRDRLLLAVYGAFSNAKKKPENARRMLNFCPFLLGKRESRRLLGDHVLCEGDVTNRVKFADAVATGSWSIDLHYDTRQKGVDFLTVCNQPHYGRYWIPFRSLYSRNVPNLMMAGRCFSATHVGLGSPRVNNTLAQLGVAVGTAAGLLRKYACDPRQLVEDGHMRELQRLIGGDWPGNPDPARANWRIVDDEDEDAVTFGKGWRFAWNPSGEQVGDRTHYARESAEPAVYRLPVERAGRYALKLKIPFHYYKTSSESRLALEIQSGGKIVEAVTNPVAALGRWAEVGTFELAPGATLTVIPARSKGLIVADGVALVERPR